MRKSLDWDAKVRGSLAARFMNAPWSLSHHENPWQSHLAADLANEEFVDRLIRGDASTFRQRVWEMRLGRHLRSCGHIITAPPRGSPDFRFTTSGGLVVWVEAISPKPGAALASNGSQVADPRTGEIVPFEDMLLRWTAALKEKMRKGSDYRAKGVIKSSEAYVVAIDGSQLCTIPITHGASRRPFVVEAALGVGPAALVIRPEGAVRGLRSTTRLTTTNRNMAPVPTASFLDPAGQDTSAVLGSYPPQLGDEAHLEVQVAYNPSASVALPVGLLGRKAEEWSAREVGRDEHGVDWEVSASLGT